MQPRQAYIASPHISTFGQTNLNEITLGHACYDIVTYPFMAQTVSKDVRFGMDLFKSADRLFEATAIGLSDILKRMSPKFEL